MIPGTSKMTTLNNRKSGFSRRNQQMFLMSKQVHDKNKKNYLKEAEEKVGYSFTEYFSLK